MAHFGTHRSHTAAGLAPAPAVAPSVGGPIGMAAKTLLWLLMIQTQCHKRQSFPTEPGALVYPKQKSH
ncbi:hypothetical protein N5C12_18860, partial [Comamonas aquatica]